MIKKTVYYIGGYEKEIRDNHIYHRIQIGDVAIVEQVDDNAESIHYTLRDHLGSLIATVSDTGTIKRLFYDPWGKRLNLPVLEAQPITLFDLASFLTPRGFTGHEHLDNVGLIHMNGRVYDPEIARFVSADPFIQDPTYLQSYNRYAYTWNNPLRMTDPSGYWSMGLDKLLGVAEVVVGGVLLYGSGGANPWGHALLGDGLRRLDNPSDEFGFSLQYQDTLGKNNNQSSSGSSSTSESTSDSGSTSGSGSLTESSDGSYSYNLGYGDVPSGYYGDITLIEQTPWQYATASEDTSMYSYVNRAITSAAGAVQIGVGGALCGTVVGCILGGPMMIHGANNLYEGIYNSPGYVRLGYQAASRYITGNSKYGDIAYNTVDMSLSAYGAARQVLKPESWKLFEHIPSDYTRSFRVTSPYLISLDVAAGASSTYNIIGAIKNEP